MKKLFLILLLLFSLIGGVQILKAENYVQQMVNFQIDEIYSANFPDHVSFVLDSFNWDFYQGMPVLVPVIITHYYDITFTHTAYIKARLQNNMQEFSVLSVTFQAPPTGSSFGKKELNYFDSGLKKGFQNLAYVNNYARAQNLRIDYEIIASLYVIPGTYSNTIEFLFLGE